MKRKLLIFMLIIISAVCLCIGIAACDSTSSSDRIKYTLSEDGTYYTVSGLTNYHYTEIDIPSTYENLPVTAIDDYAFRSCTSLTSVTIGDNVTTIGEGAFSYCSISEIAIPASVTTIGYYAFSNCNSLTKVYYNGTASQWASISFGNPEANPISLYYTGNFYINKKIVTEISIENITAINSYAFYNCQSITNITISDSVTSIGNYAFYNCKSIESVYYNGTASQWASISFGGNVLSYGNSNLYLNGTLATDITIENAISINDYAFCYCSSITSVTIGNSVTSIGKSAFFDCTSLTNISIGSGVTSIGDHAFSYCSLTSITIPDSVTSIGEYAFDECMSFTAVTIGNNVASIGEYSFRSCNSLESVTIGNNVTSIGNHAFKGCTALKEINFNATAINDLSSDNYVFYNAGQSGNGITLTIGANVTKIPDYLFYTSEASQHAPKITSVVFENGSVCKSIGDYAFSYCSLTGITIGNSVTSIGTRAFSNCNLLENVTIGFNISTIGAEAFSDCSWLKNVYYNGTASQWASILFGDIVANPMFQAKNLYINGTLATDITIENVSAISDYAFYNCSSITSITIDDSVTSIGEWALTNCSSLTTVILGRGINFIGEHAFSSCSLLNVYYKGTADEWNNITIDSANTELTNSTIYYYAESGSTTERGNYWYYDENGEIVTWSIS
ncbi:MAG: leucine-rich repeat domain-containing protein [Clostridia bacterium]|nr:leucine-rich repeat domain-containing protein [Clostridia bacterium]